MDDLRAKFITWHEKHFNAFWPGNPTHEERWAAWRAATEAAKATVTAGELFGYGSSEKKNCLLSKAQYDSCAPKNRAAYDIPLYAYRAPSCATCNDHGSVGHPPDDYWPCPDCHPAARHPAPVVAAEIDKEALRTEVRLRGRIHQLEDEITDLRAALAARSQP